MRLVMRRESVPQNERDPFVCTKKKETHVTHVSKSLECDFLLTFFRWFVVFLNASKTGREAHRVLYETKEDKEYEARETHNATVFRDEE